MTTEKLLGELRVLLGNVSVNEVPDRELISFLAPSLVWLASEVKMEILTDNTITLVANQPEYPLPRNLSWMIWIEYNGQLLTPTTTYALNAFGGNWRTTPVGVPANYAIEGRSLILNPAPSAAAISTNPLFAWRYIGTGEEFSASGTPELSDMDQQLVRYDAAIGWLSAHPTPENQLRITAYTAEINRRLPACKQRWENALTSLYPTLSPETHGRLYAARVYEVVDPLDKVTHSRYSPFKGGYRECTSVTLTEFIPESERPNLVRVGIG